MAVRSKPEKTRPKRILIGVWEHLYDETKTEEDLKAEYLCPFCSEDFDVVGLFCHIDEEHPAEAKNGRKRRLQKGGANSAFSILRKELREGSLQSLLGGSSCSVSSSNTEPDPLLSPFIFLVIVLQNWKT
ncbi:protein DEHYDRATION-INDUCED 19 homolog 4-like [Populus trichocarpa]|uniref:protein DEHYDRATION-INDUCED 19 homolog 4-like n=1 Tax=Populus trichocarpa TaxID=3694 RepID=UPI002279993B|nr:protein DEHYDRATION-INDUCED 19 homolog 4-like [Populus trichocarpa]